MQLSQFWSMNCQLLHIRRLVFSLSLFFTFPFLSQPVWNKNVTLKYPRLSGFCFCCRLTCQTHVVLQPHITPPPTPFFCIKKHTIFSPLSTILLPFAIYFIISLVKTAHFFLLCSFPLWHSSVSLNIFLSLSYIWMSSY